MRIFAPMVLAMVAFSSAVLAAPVATESSLSGRSVGELTRKIPKKTTARPSGMAQSSQQKSSNQTIQVDNNAIAEIKKQIGSNVQANVTTTIATHVAAKIATDLEIDASLFDGLIEIDGELGLNITFRGTVPLFVSKVENDIKDRITAAANIDAVVDHYLSGLVDQQVLVSKLTTLIGQIETKVFTTLKVVLPKIKPKIGADIQANLEAHLKKLQIDIPLIIDVKISSSVDIMASVTTAVTTTIKTLTKLNTQADALAIVKSL